MKHIIAAVLIVCSVGHLSWGDTPEQKSGPPAEIAAVIATEEESYRAASRLSYRYETDYEREEDEEIIVHSSGDCLQDLPARRLNMHRSRMKKDGGDKVEFSKRAILTDKQVASFQDGADCLHVYEFESMKTMSASTIEFSDLELGTVDLLHHGYGIDGRTLRDVVSDGSGWTVQYGLADSRNVIILSYSYTGTTPVKSLKITVEPTMGYAISDITEMWGEAVKYKQIIKFGKPAENLPWLPLSSSVNSYVIDSSKSAHLAFKEAWKFSEYSKQENVDASSFEIPYLAAPDGTLVLQTDALNKPHTMAILGGKVVDYDALPKRIVDDRRALAAKRESESVNQPAAMLSPSNGGAAVDKRTLFYWGAGVLFVIGVICVVGSHILERRGKSSDV